METKSRIPWLLLTAIAPLAWGSVYVVTRQVLPAESPLWGSVFRALPAAVILLLIGRRLPSGAWWWRTFVLGFLTVGGFFALIYVAGTLLPSGLAATLMSSSAAAMLLFGWALLGQRPRLLAVAGAMIGIAGVIVMFAAAFGEVDLWGVAASLGAMTSSCLGFVLTARWGSGIPPLVTTSWQLAAGSLMILPVAILVEGAPPRLDAAQLGGFAYVTVIATALAYVAWYAGMRHLPAAAVGAIGLLNPVMGVLLGVLAGGEAFGPRQGIGMLLVIVGVIIATLPSRRSLRAAGPRVVRTMSG